MQRFVIVVDTQADFMDPKGALPIAGADTLIDRMQAWLAALSDTEVVGVLFTFDTHGAELYPGSAEAEHFPIHCVRGSPGWSNVLDADCIDAAIPRYVLEKGVFNMWSETDLRVETMGTGKSMERDAFFAKLRDSGVADVVVIGVAADFCVRWAIDGLVERRFSVLIPAGLTCGIRKSIEEVLADDFGSAPVRLEAAA